eukprot:TRINITY_DN112504_c0_g1_i1.p1 TRINITY_DN112504_c0_g1~~TRINITY_DN112504_c0_g1_i1.p1  ORF type:complete len:970 (-),score=205.86 TRINITY_DN112504_c0_g1_i1:125-3034(-)
MPTMDSHSDKLAGRGLKSTTFRGMLEEKIQELVATLVELHEKDIAASVARTTAAVPAAPREEAVVFSGSTQCVAPPLPVAQWSQDSTVSDLDDNLDAGVEPDHLVRDFDALSDDCSRDGSKAGSVVHKLAAVCSNVCEPQKGLPAAPPLPPLPMQIKPPRPCSGFTLTPILCSSAPEVPDVPSVPREISSSCADSLVKVGGSSASPTSPRSEPSAPSEPLEEEDCRPGSRGTDKTLFQKPPGANNIYRLSSMEVEHSCFERTLFVPRKAWALSGDDWLDMQQRVEGKKSFQNADAEILKNASSMRRQSSKVKALTDRKPWWMFHPQDRSRVLWDMFSLLWVAMDIVMIPLQAFELERNIWVFLAEGAAMTYWTLDIFMSFVTQYYVKGNLETKMSKIATNYLKTWFFFDITLVTCESIVAVLETQTDDVDNTSARVANAVGLTRMFRILRFVRLLRLFKLWRTVNAVTNRINSSEMLLTLSIMKMLLAICCLLHMLACFWFGLGNNAKGWVYVIGIQNKPFADQYIFTFQFAMARLHPSTFGENLNLQTMAERLFAIVVSLFAVAGGGAFISAITNTMATLQQLGQQKTRKMQVFREYSQENQITTNLSLRVKSYIERSSKRKGKGADGSDSSELAQMLPLSLLLDLRFEAWIPFLISHRFFREICAKHSRMIWRFCQDVVVEESVMGDEHIFLPGDLCGQMLFIKCGELIYRPGKVVGRRASHGNKWAGTDEEYDVLEGDHISEVALWINWENQGSLWAKTDCRSLALKAEAFIEAIAKHERAMIEAASRARQVVKWMNEHVEDVSDLLDDDFIEDHELEVQDAEEFLLPVQEKSRDDRGGSIVRRFSAIVGMGQRGMSVASGGTTSKLEKLMRGSQASRRSRQSSRSTTMVTTIRTPTSSRPCSAKEALSGEKSPRRSIMVLPGHASPPKRRESQVKLDNLDMVGVLEAKFDFLEDARLRGDSDLKH